MGWKNILMLCFLFLVAVGLFAFLAFSDNGLKMLTTKRLEHEAVLAENRKMEEANAEMARTIKRLREDPFYVEFVARQDYGLAGPDDVVFAFDKTRTGKPVWPEERAEDNARRLAEARKQQTEKEEGHKPAAKKPAKAAAKKEDVKKPAPAKKDAPKEAGKKPEAKKTQKKKES